MFNLQKKLYIVLGWLFVLLGIIGAVLPLLPSTVFFIIATWFFARSSERFYQRIINDKYIGKQVKDFLENRSMPLKAKIFSIVALFTSIIISIILIERTPFKIIMLLSVAFGVAFYIISINTSPKDSVLNND